MIHFISSYKGGSFTERSDLKHWKPYVFSAFSNHKFLCEWLCIMTDQTSGYVCIIRMTENLLYFTVPPTDM